MLPTQVLLLYLGSAPPAVFSFGDVKHIVSVEPQAIYALTIDALISQKIHAAFNGELGRLRTA